jgi:uncharacterized protein
MHTAKIYKLQENEKQKFREIITDSLLKHAEVSFAYVFGSFIAGDGFRDIDVAVFLRDLPESVLEYERRLESELMTVVHVYPVDVRILNRSPLSFRYRVIKEGAILFARSDDERSDFQEATLSAYFDFAPYRALYLKETLGSGV